VSVISGVLPPAPLPALLLLALAIEARLGGGRRRTTSVSEGRSLSCISRPTAERLHSSVLIS
jgi:hypothetical protein